MANTCQRGQTHRIGCTNVSKSIWLFVFNSMYGLILFSSLLLAVWTSAITTSLLYLTVMIWCHMWSDSTWAQERGSGLYQEVLRSPFSFRAILMTLRLYWAKASSFTTEVNTSKELCLFHMSHVSVYCDVTSFHFLQRWNQMTHALPFRKLSLAGAAPPTRLWWEAVC